MLIPREPQNYSSVTTNDTERFVQSVLDALSSHIAILNDNGDIIGVNTAWRNFARHNGLRDANYGIGTNYLAVCDNAVLRNSSDALIIANGLRDVMRGKVVEFEMEYPCHSPIQRRWFVVRVSRFEWHNNTRYIISHQNVTELKQVHIELAQSKRRIEAILDNVNNGIVTIDPKGVILTANRAATRIFACELDELIGAHMSELMEEPFQGQSTFHKLNGIWGHEMTGRRADGTTFPMYFSLNELRLEDGSVYTCIIQDITLRKQGEYDRLERERMQVALEKERELRVLKNRFLSMMSHELRTPLASISLSYDLLKKYSKVATPEERTQALDNIQTQVSFLADMVSDVMTLSRSDSDNFQLITEDSDLITYCRDVVEEFYFNYHKTHNIEFECPDNSITAPIDRKFLRRAFTNLLSNAIKYSPKGGTVLFHLHQESEEAVIRVSDQGIGIPVEDLERLFEPFHRAANVENLPGTGLGLPVTKQMIDLHHGTIDCESSVGQGTTFTIRLPLRSKED
jgi:PAS domain S-box-containing protein